VATQVIVRAYGGEAPTGRSRKSQLENLSGAKVCVLQKVPSERLTPTPGRATPGHFGGETMTRTEYGAQVTAIIDAATGGFEYPESFESDVDACFNRRMTPEQAAEKLLADYTG
jgi:hypothetical protein